MSNFSKSAHHHLVTYIPVQRHEPEQSTPPPNESEKVGYQPSAKYVSIREGSVYMPLSDGLISTISSFESDLPQVPLMEVKQSVNYRERYSRNNPEDYRRALKYSSGPPRTRYLPTRDSYTLSTSDTFIDPKNNYEAFQELPKVKSFGREWSEMWKIKELIGWVSGECLRMEIEKQKLIKKKEHLRPKIVHLLQLCVMKEQKTKEQCQKELYEAKKGLLQTMEQYFETEKKVGNIRKEITNFMDKLQSFPRMKKATGAMIISLQEKNKQIFLHSKKLDRLVEKIVKENEKMNQVVHISADRLEIVKRREKILMSRLEEMKNLSEDESNYSNEMGKFMSFEDKENHLRYQIKETILQRRMLNKSIQDIKYQITVTEGNIQTERMPLLEIQSHIDRCECRLGRVREKLYKAYQKNRKILKRVKDSDVEHRKAKLSQQISAIEKDTERLRAELNGTQNRVRELAQVRESIQELEENKEVLIKHLNKLAKRKKKLTKHINLLNASITEKYPHMTNSVSMSPTPILKQRRAEKKRPTTSSRRNSVSFSDRDKKPFLQSSFQDILKMIKPHFPNVIPIPYSIGTKMSGKDSVCVEMPSGSAKQVAELKRQQYERDAQLKHKALESCSELTKTEQKKTMSSGKNAMNQSIAVSNSTVFSDGQSPTSEGDSNSRRDSMLNSGVSIIKYPETYGSKVSSTHVGDSDGWLSLAKMFGIRSVKDSIAEGKARNVSSPEISTTTTCRGDIKCKEVNYSRALPSIMAVPSILTNGSAEANTLVVSSLQKGTKDTQTAHWQEYIPRPGTIKLQKESITQTTFPTKNEATINDLFNPFTSLIKHKYWPILSSFFPKDFFWGQSNKKEPLPLRSADTYCQTSTSQMKSVCTSAASLKPDNSEISSVIMHPIDLPVKLIANIPITSLIQPLGISTQTSWLSTKSLENNLVVDKVSDINSLKSKLSAVDGSVNADTIAKKESLESEKYVMLPQSCVPKSEDLLKAEIAQENFIVPIVVKDPSQTSASDMEKPQQVS